MLFRDEVSTYKKQIEIEKSARMSIQKNYYSVIATQKVQGNKLYMAVSFWYLVKRVALDKSLFTSYQKNTDMFIL